MDIVGFGAGGQKMNVKWWKAAGIRAIKTFAQSFAAGLTIGATMQDISWGYLASTAAVAAIYSLAMSLAGLPEVKDDEGDGTL